MAKSNVIRLIVWLFLHIIASGVSLQFGDNSCVSNTSGTLQFYACYSNPLTVLRPNVSLFVVDVTPPNITCGTTEQEICTLGTVETCSYCDNSNIADSHPPQYMYDYNSNDLSSNLNTYWESVTWLQAGGCPQANITISMGRLFQFWDDFSIVFESMEPQQMTLLKSIDNGVTFTPLQYCNVSCANQWNNGIPARPTYATPNAVCCTQDYSSQYPSSGGIGKFSVEYIFNLYLTEPLMTDYANLYNAFNTTDLMSFLLFTDLRIQLIYPATDGKEAYGNPSDLIRYYYAISDISLIAGCWCNLHGKECYINGSRMVCNCSHNTAGDSCETCLPLFNNRPWMPGFSLPYPSGSPNPCQACNCNNHASSCTYNPSFGYGVCNFCSANTTGYQCQQCLSGFYQNILLPLSDPNICIPCNCQPLGVNNNDTTCFNNNGQCNCKFLVMGLQCNICVDQFYGLLQFGGICQSCSCSTFGTVGGSNICDKVTGQCPCKPGISSRDCSICSDGFYQYPAFLNPSQNCLPCTCDLGGSTSVVCNKQSGQCSCRPNMIGRRCSQPANNYFVPLLDFNSAKPSSTIGNCLITSGLVSTVQPYTGRTYALCNQTNTLSFDILANIQQAALTGQYIPVLRYGLNGSLPWSSLGLQIQVIGTNTTANLTQYNNNNPSSVPVSPICSLQSGLSYIFQMSNLTTGYGNAYFNLNATDVTLDVRCLYSTTLIASNAGGATQPIFIDSLVMMPDYRQSLVFTNQSNLADQQECESCVSLYMSLETSMIAVVDSFCLPFFLSVMSQFEQGALPCNCNLNGTVNGTVCNPAGGQCQCQPGVAGMSCQYCQQGFYNFTNTGCTACNCNVMGSSNLVCNYTSGQCPCRSNIATYGQTNTLGIQNDLQCHNCLSNYYGVTTGQGCQPCNCSPIGSNMSQCAESGACLCLPTIGGNNCNSCLAGLYNFSSSGCIPCNCSNSGSLNITCNNLSGSCYCKPNVQGLKCNNCTSGTFDLAASNPDGCQMCFCFGHGQQCSSATGFSQFIITDNNAYSWQPALDHITYIQAPSSFLGDMHSSYGQWINYTVQSRPGVVVNFANNSQPILLVGNGLTIAFLPVNYTVTNVMSQLSVPIHQDYWYIVNNTQQPLSAFTMSGVLANMTRMLIGRLFGYDFINVTNVMMNSAMPSPDGSSGVNYVENCTCNPTQNVAGLSCGNCSQGFQRPPLPSSSLTPTSGLLYQSCIACSCNGRSQTPVPICDQWTGVCLNCQPGTNGSNCQTCAANVALPNCNQCQPGYWGISNTGCTPCNCSAYGIIPGTNCDPVTGQCACNSLKNVTGQGCYQCMDNYANTSSGCILCNNCYGLVVNLIQSLRTNQTNLTSLVTLILNQDNSSTIGPFNTRLTNALNNISALNIYMSPANNLVQTLPATIASLNATLLLLLLNITTFIAPTINSVSSNVKSADANTAAAIQAINATTVSMIQTYNQLQNTMPQFTAQLQSLQFSLQNVLNQISGSSNAIVSGILLLNQTVVWIQSNATAASNASQYALQLMQNAKGQQLTLLNEQLPTLAQTIQSLNITGQMTNANAITIQNETNLLLLNATLIYQSVQSFQVFPVNVNATLTIIQQQQTTANSIITQSSSAQSANQLIINQVPSVNAQTIQLSTQVNATKSAADSLNNRVIVANQTTTNAVNLAQNTTSQAQTMVNILQNFNQQAQNVQSQANASLQIVQSILTLSQQASNNSAVILQTLQNPIASSIMSQQVASQAVTASNTLNQALSPVSNEANTLMTQASSVLNDVYTKSSQIYQQNNTIIAQLLSSLNNYMSMTSALEAKALQARTLADNVTAIVHSTQNSINTLQTTLGNIGPQIPPPGLIQQLLANVQSTNNYYNSLGLPAIVAGLNTTIINQRITINGLLNSVSEQQQLCTRLQILLAQLK